jgi:glutamate-ammonia-ligase adenylyltransferase
MRARGLADASALDVLIQAWVLQQNLSQVLKLALSDAADPTAEPKPLQALLARAGGARNFAELEKSLTQARKAAHAAFLLLTKISD